MATGTGIGSRKSRYPLPQDEMIQEDRIIIERREVIAEVPLSVNGQGNPIVVAYERMAQYLVDETQNTGRIELEFRYGSTLFRATSEAEENPNRKV